MRAKCTVATRHLLREAWDDVAGEGCRYTAFDRAPLHFAQNALYRQPLALLACLQVLGGFCEEVRSVAKSPFPLEVVSSSDGTVVLRGHRSTLCGRCACDLPGTGQTIWEVRVKTEALPPEGTRVHVEIPPREFLLGVAILYGLPLLFLFGAVALGVWLAPKFGVDGASASVEVVSACGGFILSLPALRFLDRKLGDKPGFKPRLVWVAAVPQRLLGPEAADVGEEECRGLAETGAVTD